MNEEFLVNILRASFAQLHFQSGMLCAREMFGRSYFSLGIAEKTAVDQAVMGFVGSNYNMLTPEWLAGQKQNPIGFVHSPQTNQPGAPRSQADQTQPVQQ